MAADLKIIVLEGDETGQELLEQAIRVLDPDVTGLQAELVTYDLSLDHRRETENAVVTEAAEAMREAGFGLKAATITPEGKDDVGSPNRILREAVDGKVIIRTGRRIPGVVGPVSGVHFPISVVRMAVEDAYGAKQWREGVEGADDEVAYRTEKVTRSTCRAVAEYAFRTAERTQAVVYGGPKWTVSPVYEGMLKEEMDRAAERHPEVEYRPVLIDATYAGLISGAAETPLVIPALNRDGDCLSDLVLPMFGSIAGAESVLLAFDDDHEVDVAMAEAPHGTAPSLLGKDLANPMAMILAGAALLSYAHGRGVRGAERASRAIYEGVLETIAGGLKTIDLGGHATTSEFTDAVIEKVRTKVDIWSSLGSQTALRTGRLGFWLRWWVVLFVLYVLLVFKTEPAEFVAGAVAAALAATGATLVRNRAARGERIHGRMRAVRFPGAGRTDAEGLTRRALEKLFGSVAPNSFVVGFDQRHDVVVVHQLERTEEPPRVDWGAP